MLLERQQTSVVAAVEQLVAMQAQVPRPPFVGLWTRLREFKREALVRALRDKSVVRATALRGTIHVLSARDYRRFRDVIGPALVKGAQSIVGKRDVNLTEEQSYALGREFFARPAPFDAFRKHLEARKNVGDVRAIAYTVRLGIPLVMVPDDDAAWGFSAKAGFVNADAWLGSSPSKPEQLESLVMRYLAGYGPATPGDAQTWSGIRGLRDTFELLRPRLVTFRDARKRELFDLPDAPRPVADEPAAVRFLPEYDNVLLAHEDRTRIIADAHKPAVFLKNLQVRGTFLVDGFVAGVWRVDRRKAAATLTLTRFTRLAKADAADVEGEAEALIRFLEPDAKEASVAWER